MKIKSLLFTLLFLLMSITQPAFGDWKRLNFGGSTPNALDEKSVAGTESADFSCEDASVIAIKTEYSANNVTAKFWIVLKDHNSDVGRIYSTQFTPLNTGENEDIQETGFFHGETRFIPTYRAKYFRVVLAEAPTNTGTVSVWAKAISYEQAQFPLNVTNYDASGNEGFSLIDGNDGTRKAEFDDYFKVPIHISVEHHKNHEGESFERHIDSANAAVASLNVAFKTVAGNELAHMLYGWASNDEILFTIIEGASWTQGSGTALNIVNTNRDIGSTSTVILEDKNQATFTASDQVIKNVTGISGGTTIDNQYTYNASLGVSTIAETRSATHEWPLKNNTTYVIEMKQTDGNCKMTINLHWYEHDSSE